MKLCLLMFTAVAAVLGPSNHAAGGEADRDALLSTVIEQWRRREDATRSFRFVWQGRQFRGADYHALPQDGDVPANVGQIRIALTTCLHESGCLAKFETDRDYWRAKESRFVPGSTVVSFDGDCQWSLAHKGGEEYPRGAIGGAPDGTLIVKNVWFLPLRMMYWPFHEKFGVFNADELVLASDSDVVDGRECLVVSQSDPKGRVLKVWVDPSREYVPIQYTKALRGVPRRHISIDYVNDPELGWVPSSWKRDELNPKSEIMESLAAQVVQREVNAEFTAERFAIEFPSGTYVRDYRDDTTYILREGDEPRPVRRGEFTGDNYEQLLHGDPPVTGATGSWRLFASATSAAVLLAVILVVIRRARRAAGK